MDKKRTKKETFLKTMKVMETKVEIQGNPLSEEDFKKLNGIQQQADDKETNQEERDIFQNISYCFEGFFH
jgi:hypothetical protein